ncbi:MAG: TlpA family protein disulfide reductase [Deltaproteobacteria bacterium]|nr:TlpA family protein disulfide reductase [Nannocystaceae bacterium]
MTRGRIAGFVLVALVAASAVHDTVVGIDRFDRYAPVAVGRDAPSFDVELLGGGRFADTDLPGRVHVISFWASWCGYCRNELAQIDRELLDRYADDVRFVAVNREGGGMSPEDAREISKRYRQGTGLRVPIAVDPGKMARAFGVGGIPHTAVFDRAGKLRHVHTGLVDAEELADEIDELLEE